MTPFKRVVAKSTPNAEPEAVESPKLYTKLFAALNLTSSLAIVEDGVKVKVAVAVGFIINPALVEPLTTVQFTNDDKEAELNTSL
jgi:hypothetical protein